MSRIVTKAYAPGSSKITMQVRGAVARDTAITFAKQDLEAQIEAAREALDAPEEDWRVVVTATEDTGDVQVAPGGQVTFPPDDKTDVEVDAA